MARMQYQALLKATGGTQGSRPTTTANEIAAVQRRLVAKNLERPEANRDIYTRTWSLIEAEEEGTRQEAREWQDYDLAWLKDNQDGYSDVLTAMLGTLELGEEVRPS